MRRERHDPEPHAEGAAVLAAVASSCRTRATRPGANGRRLAQAAPVTGALIVFGALAAIIAYGVWKWRK